MPALAQKCALPLYIPSPDLFEADTGHKFYNYIL